MNRSRILKTTWKGNKDCDRRFETREFEVLRSDDSNHSPSTLDPPLSIASAAAQKYSYEAPKKSTSKWLKYGLPLLILILIGGGVGGYFGYKATQDSDSSTSTAKAGDTNSWTGTTNSVPSNIDSSTSSAASNAAKAGGGNDITYSGTDIYANPMFISAASNLGAPTMGGNQVGNCGSDPYSGTGSLDADSLRPHPRLMAPQHIWDCLPEKIANDAYLTVWNASIFKNATAWAAEAPVAYVTDGGLVGSGILDPARDVQQRVKAWSYAYQVSKDTKWVDRLWTELQTAAGNTSQEWGQGNVEGTDAPHWNSAHFLDLAELTAAYAIAYDWLYNIWTDDQKTAIMWSIISLGLVPGNAAHDTGSGWFFQPENGNGNWNCVTNSGLMLGSLAVLGDDPTTNSADLLKKSIDNMSANCMRGVYKDGSWAGEFPFVRFSFISFESDLILSLSLHRNSKLLVLRYERPCQRCLLSDYCYWN